MCPAPADRNDFQPDEGAAQGAADARHEILLAILAGQGRQIALTGPRGAGKSALLEAARQQALASGRAAVLVRALGECAPPLSALEHVFGEWNVPATLEHGTSGWLEATSRRAELTARLLEAALTAAPDALWLVDDAECLDAASRELLALIQAASGERSTWVHAGTLPWPGASPLSLPGARATAGSEDPRAFPRAARDLLLHLAALGGPADVADALAVGDAAALAALVTEGWLRKDGAMVLFRDPDLGEAILADADADERREAHARVFRVLSARYLYDACSFQQRVRIALAGVQGAVWPEARPWALAAARQALGLAEAGLAETLLHGLPPGPAGQPETDEEDYLRVGILRARGDLVGARALLGTGLLSRLCQRDGELAVEVVTTAGVLAQLAGDYEEAASRYREAIAHSDRIDAAAPGVRARLFAGRLAYFRGQANDAGTHFERALDLASREAPALHGWALGLYGHWLTTHPGRLEAGLAALHEAIVINRMHGRVYHAHEALVNLGDALLANQRTEDARDAFAQCLALAERVGLGVELPVDLVNLASVELVRGDWPAAEALASRALVASQATGRRYPLGLALASLGLAEVQLGRANRGLERLQEAARLGGELGNRAVELMATAHLAEARLALGHWSAARAALVRATRLAADASLREQDARLARVHVALEALETATCTYIPAAPGTEEWVQQCLLEAARDASPLQRLLGLVCELLEARRAVMLVYDGLVPALAASTKSAGLELAEAGLWLAHQARTAGDVAIASAPQSGSTDWAIAVPLGMTTCLVGVVLVETPVPLAPPLRSALLALGRQAAPLVMAAWRKSGSYSNRPDSIPNG